MLTRKLLLILVLAAPFAAAGGLLVLVAVAIVGLALVAAVADWLLARDGRQLSVTRQLASDKLSLGEWNPVSLLIENHSARPQKVDVRDIPPPLFGLDRDPRFSVAVDSGATAMLTYRVRPPTRGDACFADVYIRIDGPMGLIRRAFRQHHTAQAVRVYPSLRELRRFDLVARRGFELSATGRPVRHAGASREFERLREYVPDDDIRHVNWKATARRGHPMVNAFQAERSQNLVILLDVGRAMAALADPPPDDPDKATASALTKLDYAINAALLLSYVASNRGDRVALLAYADEVRTFVPPKRGRRAILETVGALYNLSPQPVEPDHARAFEYLGQRNLRRSLVVLFTDLTDAESATTLAAHLTRAAHQHVVVCVTLADPNVLRPANQRPLDASSLYQKMVAQNLLDDRAALLARLAARGVLTLDTDASALHPRLIATYLDLKERGRV